MCKLPVYTLSLKIYEIIKKKFSHEEYEKMKYFSSSHVTRQIEMFF